MIHLTYIRVFISVVALAGTAYGGQIVDPVIVEHGPRDAKKVALTFDACPTGREDEYDERVIEVLTREKVPATLFMSGRWVEKNRDTAKALSANPQFEIANHAFWHPHMLEKDDERILRELKRTQDIIRKTTGKRPKYFRPPFGEVDERLAKLAAQAGLVTVQYDIASGDPDPGLSAKRIIRGVVGEAKGGSIVVFHMNENGARTAEVLPEVIKQLREKGFELVTVGELLAAKDQKSDRTASPTRSVGDRRGQGDEKTRGTGTGPTAAMTSTRDTSISKGTATDDALRSGAEHTGLTGSGAVQ
jgi:peptidoglycan/xylan/chitin deacetylase (PgdA/CDA1 family)